jgi:hypothetical protein
MSNNPFRSSNRNFVRDLEHQMRRTNEARYLRGRSQMTEREEPVAPTWPRARLELTPFRDHSNDSEWLSGSSEQGMYVLLVVAAVVLVLVVWVLAR